jgi:PAS domain S-box-containing protein
MTDKKKVLPNDPALPQPVTDGTIPNGMAGVDKVIFRYLLQPIGHFQFISSNIALLTGHDQSEFYKTPSLWVQCLHPDDRAGQAHVLLGHPDGEVKHLRIHKPGQGYIPLEQVLTISSDDEGQPLKIEAVCQVKDEEQIHLMEGDLSTQGIQQMLFMSPTPLAINSIESRQLLFASKSFVDYLQYPLDELKSMTLSRVPIWIDPSDRDDFERMLVSQQNTTPLLVHLRAADGSVKQARVAIQTVVFQGQACFMSQFSDVTDSEDERNKLKLEFETLSRIIENSPLSINVSDIHGNTVLWNRQSEKLFGWTKAEILGQTMPFVRDYGDEAYLRFWENIRDRDTWSGTDVRLKCKNGSEIVLCMYNSPVMDQEGNMTGVLGILTEKNEIGQARLMQQALFNIASATNETNNLDDLYRSIHQALSILMPAENIFIALYDENRGMISYPYYQDQYDLPPEPSKAERGLTALVIRSGESQLVDPARFEELVASGEVESVGTPSIDWLGVPLKVKNRTFGMIAVQSYTEGVRFTEEHKELLEFVSDQIAMAVERVRNEETIRINEKRYHDILEDQTDLILRFHTDGVLTFTNQAFCDYFGLDRKRAIGSSVLEIFSRQRINRITRNALQPDGKHISESFENEHVLPDGRTHWVQWKTRAIFTENGNLEEIQAVGRDMTEQHLRHREMELITNITSATRLTHSTREILDEILDEISETISMDALGFSLYNSGGEIMTLDYVRGIWKGFHHAEVPISHAIIWETFRTRGLYLNNRLGQKSINPPSELTRGLVGIAGIPLISEDTPIGMLWLGKKGPITDEEIRLIKSVGEITANGIHRISLFEKTQERLRRLTTLKTIDLAITSTVDLKVILDILIDQIVNQLGVDASSIWLFDPVTQLLEYRAGRGFSSAHFKNYRLRLGESHAGRVALERKREIVHNLDEINDSMTEFYRKLGEEFTSFIAVPLIAKGQVKGVLEIFTKRPLNPDAEWLEFLDSLGGQAAIALDNATMFDRLQRSNIELGLAYDATIDGWARALEMRDQETIGHTRRVADLTIGLVKLLDDNMLDIEQVRRGVMLHDIGKMGIPDRILLKKARLTPDEWKIMRMHPSYAYDMLHSVPNLRKLVDIPYSHHERWDGGGYPRGLKGEEIPLAARLFTVVDVWDAIRSDRPYRPAWPEKKAIEYMREEIGKKFDPRLVQLFLDNLTLLIKPETGYPVV